MTAEASDFKALSRETAMEFLQTVVVVDDEAWLHKDERPKDEAAVPIEKSVKKPVRGDATNATPTGESVATRTRRDGQHDLNAKRLVDAFAAHGLICSVFRPGSEGEMIGEGTIRTARRADIVVLDWVIFNDIGDKTIELIQRIIQSDKRDTKQRRVIAVYTGEPDLAGIVDRIKGAIGGEQAGSGEHDSFTINKGAFRIVVFAKEHVKETPGQSDRKVLLDDLPMRLVEEFAETTSGLVSNVAVHALSVLRQNTYDILTTLHSGLDPAYLSHRALLPQPDDVAEHLIALITVQLRSILEEYDVGGKAGMPQIKAWLSHTYADGPLKIGGKDVARTSVIDLLEKGLDRWRLPGASNKEDERFRRHGFKSLTEAFSRDEATAQTADIELAMLTTLKTRYQEDATSPPMLTLGTIVAKKVESQGSISWEYWLCIQPRCDSVRLQHTTSFPFLPYKIIANNREQGFDLALRDGNNLWC